MLQPKAACMLCFHYSPHSVPPAASSSLLSPQNRKHRDCGASPMIIFNITLLCLSKWTHSKDYKHEGQHTEMLLYQNYNSTRNINPQTSDNNNSKKTRAAGSLGQREGWQGGVSQLPRQAHLVTCRLPCWLPPHWLIDEPFIFRIHLL